MELLKLGSSWFYQVRCRGNENGDCGCNSLLQVEKDDIYITVDEGYDGRVALCFSFRCPVCNQETNIMEYKIPAAIKIKALKNYKRKCIKQRKYLEGKL